MKGKQGRRRVATQIVLSVDSFVLDSVLPAFWPRPLFPGGPQTPTYTPTPKGGIKPFHFGAFPLYCLVACMSKTLQQQQRWQPPPTMFPQKRALKTKYQELLYYNLY